MLPFGGQGANQAIEDAGALGLLLTGIDKAEDIPSRLALFEKVRRLRASRIQTLSTVRLGKEKEVEQKLRKYADPPGAGGWSWRGLNYMLTLIQQFRLRFRNVTNMILGLSIIYCSKHSKGSLYKQI